MLAGSGFRFGSGSNTKWNTRVKKFKNKKIKNKMTTSWETMLQYF
jgi:hypothetical protein